MADTTREDPSKTTQSKPDDKSVTGGSTSGSQAKAKTGSKLSYFKTDVAGLRLMVDGGDTKEGRMPEYVRFEPHFETYQGDRVRVGYLATDNAKAIKMAKEDYTVEQISKEDYEKATKPKK